MGLTFEKLLVIAVIAVIIVGPERLPAVAETLGRWARRLRSFAGDARTRLKDELGEEFSEEDWRKLDPRQYDPRRIIREALLDDQPGAVAAAARSDGASDGASGASGDTRRGRDGVSGGPGIAEVVAPGDRPPYDGEAT